jgi:hypothetical protein
VEAKTYYTIQDGTEVAAIVISPTNPPAGSGLKRPDFQPVTTFAYRDPGNPYLPSIIFLVASVILFLVHMVLLGVAERRRPLGGALTPTDEGRPAAGAGPAARPSGPVDPADGPGGHGRGGEGGSLGVGQDGEPADRDVHGREQHRPAQLPGRGRGPVGVAHPEGDPPARGRGPPAVPARGHRRSAGCRA